MPANRKLPFQNMTPRAWQNLGMAALSVFYLVQIGLDVYWHDTCGHLAIDYCAFWSAGRVANAQGYAQIYNLEVLQQIQRSIFPDTLAGSGFVVSPVAYLPIFILPFQLLALLGPVSGFWVWTLLNSIALILYLRFFIRDTAKGSLPSRILLMILLSLPAYWNFFNGQVNVWLTICMGECIRAGMSGRDFRAGVWLAGLLIKPQVLVLLLAALLLQRAVKTLAGFAAASVIILGASWLMIGTNGFQRLLQLWLGFTNGLPTNDVEIMMNWRMVGLHLSLWSTPPIGWLTAGTGMVITISAALHLWHRRLDPHSPPFVIALLGTLAATGAVAWHSHVHMAMILIPALLYLNQQKQLPDKILNFWAFLPAAAYFLAFLLASLVQADILPSVINGFLNFARGAAEFGLNIYLLVWASQRIDPDRQSQDAGLETGWNFDRNNLPSSKIQSGNEKA